MKKIFCFIVMMLPVLLWYSCTKDERVEYTDPNAPAPKQVTNVKVEDTPGGAILTYNIPQDPNFLYVKAVYETQPGIVREAKASAFSDTLKLVGYGDVKQHLVKLYSVGKNEKASEAVVLNINPKTPPVVTAFENISLIAGFGGVRINFKNEAQANLTIVLMADTMGNGNWIPVNTFYTGAKEGGFSVRGFSATEKKFAVYLKDRWNNKSETLVKTLTPLYEEMISKGDFKVVKLAGDTHKHIENFVIENLWDGRLGSNIFATDDVNPMPQTFTIDLGKKVIISRLKEFQFNDHCYNYGSVKSFELWGSNNPDPDGGWTQWTLLGRFDSFKPSGELLGTVTPEDRNYAVVNGEDFEFQDPPAAVRYVRWKTTSTYNRIGQVVIAELTFFGKIQP